MKRISTTLVAGLLIAGLIAPTQLLAQESELALPSDPAKAPKLTLKSVEGQVTTLQSQVSALQSALAAVQPNFAVVNQNGTLARGSKSVVSSKSLGIVGTYQVIFDRDVTGCEINATLGAPDSGGFSLGFIGVASREDNPEGVFVNIEDTKGNDLNAPFHISVICP
jgi:hypothetical protein